jgi:SNF2 family DNA or RNA helicase
LINSDLVTLQSDHEHDTPGTSVRDNDQQKDKMANLKHILTTKLDPDVCKVLVFSSYDMSLHHITSSLSSDDNAILGKYRFKCLRGNEAQVQATVKSYRRVASEGTDRLNMLFVNARNFGSGINLENTTDIIMFHKLDSELEKQVIGRAQRMGRVAPLNVWYLLHENEIARQHPSTSTAS